MRQEAAIGQKQELRKKVLVGRSGGHRCGHSHSQLLIDYVWERRIKSVACYISFGNEPSTNLFLKHCQLDDRIDLYVPRVAGEHLEWVEFSAEQIKHPLGMNEPTGEAKTLSEVELLVMPALGIDRKGHRLGRGRGYFDRASKQISAKTTIALVHDDELFELVPTEPHDANVDGVCTCGELILF
jgi:5-formyltetrahydrofolate cyclo-ligase